MPFKCAFCSQVFSTTEDFILVDGSNTHGGRRLYTTADRRHIHDLAEVSEAEAQQAEEKAADLFKQLLAVPI